MKFSIPNAISRRAAMAVLKTQKHSPTILFGVGIVGMGATVVTASRATLRLEGVLEAAKKDMSDSHQLFAEQTAGKRDNYPERDHKSDLLHIYIRTGVQIGKLYGPSIILGALTVAALTGSHRILSSRNAGLTAAYAAVDKAFNEYRARVVEEYGEDKDREFRYGVEEATITIEDKNGPKKKTVKVAGEGKHSMYAKVFGEGNVNWNREPEYNLAFLKHTQLQLTDRLRARGHLFLNEVYEELGFDHTPAGSQVGWLYNKGTGDDYVDFGIWTKNDMEGTINFMNGWEDSIVLDFNVDGVIWKDI